MLKTIIARTILITLSVVVLPAIGAGVLYQIVSAGWKFGRGVIDALGDWLDNNI